MELPLFRFLKPGINAYVLKGPPKPIWHYRLFGRLTSREGECHDLLYLSVLTLLARAYLLPECFDTFSQQ